MRFGSLGKRMRLSWGLVPWTGWAWLKCVLEAVKNAGWPFGNRGARGALGLL